MTRAKGVGGRRIVDSHGKYTELRPRTWYNRHHIDSDKKVGAVQNMRGV